MELGVKRKGRVRNWTKCCGLDACRLARGELDAFCKRLAQQPFIAVDTEFMRETTYWPRLCLIQAAGPDAAAVIDPLADGLDLKPFLALMADAKIEKVFHAGRQDVEIFN